MQSFRKSGDSALQKIAAMYSKSDEAGVLAGLMTEYCRGEASKFYEYFQVLPKDIPNLNQVDPSLLDQLEDDSLAAQVKMVQQDIEAQYSAFKSKVMGDPELWDKEKLDIPAPTLEQYRWGASVVDSRGLRFTGRVYLAPFADMFNYAPHTELRDSNQGNFFLEHHKVDEETGDMIILSDRQAMPGQQLYEDYGDNSDQIYAQYHGFVAEANPFRCVRLALPGPGDMKWPPVGTKYKPGAGKLEILQKLRFNLQPDSRRGGHVSGPSQCVRDFKNLEVHFIVYLTIMAFSERETAHCLEAFDQNPQLSWPALSQWCGFYATQNRFLGYGVAKKAIFVMLDGYLRQFLAAVDAIL